jgi:ribonuclease HI
LNQDLWQELDLLNAKQVNWHYVKGHAGNEGNERCDVIARAFSLGKRPSLRQEAASVNLKQSLVASESSASEFHPSTTSAIDAKTLEAPTISSPAVFVQQDATMNDSSLLNTPDGLEDLPREVRVAQLQHVIETLTIADEIASKGYLITSSELADLMDVNASAVTSRGDNWVWRNWVVSRVRREGNQILWQLERVD